MHRHFHFCHPHHDVRIWPDKFFLVITNKLFSFKLPFPLFSRLFPKLMRFSHLLYCRRKIIMIQYNIPDTYYISCISMGDLPSVDTKPPETVLFVCKLNSVTDSSALELIFSRFGAIKSCEVVRDWKTGDSLQYAFIEYEKEESCNEAYIKMNNVKIDDRRIHVDFSQSVSREWNAFRRRHVKGAYGKKRDR